jgi:crotonobetainyl-CoA:carnitine CoA-transferase CaiB-like acyl-CoA transferase
MNDAPPPRIGNRDPYMAPHGLFHCQGDDRWVSIVVANEDEWRRFCSGWGRSELANDPRFATLAARQQHEDELEQLITA